MCLNEKVWMLCGESAFWKESWHAGLQIYTGAKGGAGIMSRNLTQLNCSMSLSDGELYAGVYVDFMGADPAVFRTLGTKTVMRTDQYNSRWLNGKCPVWPINAQHA